MSKQVAVLRSKRPTPHLLIPFCLAVAVALASLGTSPPHAHDPIEGHASGQTGQTGGQVGIPSPSAFRTPRT